MWSLPLLIVLTVFRVPLCRRNEPLPRRRAVDLVRVARVLVGAILVTLASDWASLVLGAHRSDWNAATAACGVLTAGFTAAALAVLRQLHHAERRVAGSPAVVASQPDWFGDAVLLGGRVAGRLGPLARSAGAALRWVDERVVGHVRSHPLIAAAGFSVAFGVAIDAPQVLLEGYAAGLAVLFIGVSACAVFAFLVIVGSHLRLVERRASPPGRLVVVLVAACTSVPLSASFRGSLWWVIDTTDRQASVAQLWLLVLVMAVATSLATGAVEPLVRRRH